MCNFKSFIATKDKLLEAFGVDSHETLIEIFGLKDNTSSPNFVRLELTPPATGSWLFADKWNFKVDQDLLPDWFVKEEWENRCREWLMNAPVLTGECGVLADRYLFAENAKIKSLVGHSVVLFLRGSSSVKAMCGSSSVETMYESSSVETMYDSSSVETMYDSSSVKTMCGSSSVKAMCDSSSVETMYDSSSVKTMCGSSSVKAMCGSSSVKAMCGSSSVETMCGSSSVKTMYGSSSVKEMYDSSSAPKAPEKKA